MSDQYTCSIIRFAIWISRCCLIVIVFAFFSHLPLCIKKLVIPKDNFQRVKDLKRLKAILMTRLEFLFCELFVLKIQSWKLKNFKKKKEKSLDKYIIKASIGNL
ncbi:hypothetical protein BpHYR1_042340 [Brachionus plicatilis]|uniref:Uncharacterized protein n=1 Tax=Brachionus plicatilis TaxID=10195 RepID=A0A3M7SUI3_BRAPC|nr:hypothetical protein BpHYR1_042340 [Brachionus plicatilis]